MIYRNIVDIQITFSGDNVPSTVGKIYIRDDELRVFGKSAVIIEKEQHNPLNLHQLVILGLDETFVKGSLEQVDCLNMLLNGLQDFKPGVLTQKTDLISIYDENEYPDLKYSESAFFRYIKFFYKTCFIRRVVSELKMNECMAGSSINYDELMEM